MLTAADKYELAEPHEDREAERRQLCCDAVLATAVDSLHGLCDLQWEHYEGDGYVPPGKVDIELHVVLPCGDDTDDLLAARLEQMAKALRRNQ